MKIMVSTNFGKLTSPILPMLFGRCKFLCPIKFRPRPLPTFQLFRPSTRQIESCVPPSPKTHVRECEIGGNTKPWSTLELYITIKRRKNLRGMVTENRTEYLKASTEVRKLMEDPIGGLSKPGFTWATKAEWAV